ncbi:MAG: tetratricopeptide repeat protein, partial [Pseudomonadota bacterium]|nr:tetratricopeptide repeat protein [Pseudomonadota bacterium]
MSEDHDNGDANTDPLTFVQAASQFAAKSQWGAALSFCQKALDADPNIELAGYLAGIACVQLGRNSDAVNYLKAAISTDEDDIAKLGILIALLQEARRSEDAIPYLRRHVELE